jgi:transposase
VHRWLERTSAQGGCRRGKNLLHNETCDHALGRSRGGFGSKLHLLTDSTGLPLAVAVSPGQAAEMRFASAVLEQVRIGQPRGRPRQRPDALAGDHGYSFPSGRAWLREHHIEPIIPWRRDHQGEELDEVAYPVAQWNTRSE